MLELERLGNDDEKAFLIGLILTRLYEYRQVQAKGQTTSPLQHITVFEEAHRLLKNVSTQVKTESANRAVRRSRLSPTCCRRFEPMAKGC